MSALLVLVIAGLAFLVDTTEAGTRLDARLVAGGSGLLAGLLGGCGRLGLRDGEVEETRDGLVDLGHGLLLCELLGGLEDPTVVVLLVFQDGIGLPDDQWLGSTLDTGGLRSVEEDLPDVAVDGAGGDCAVHIWTRFLVGCGAEVGVENITGCGVSNVGEDVLAPPVVAGDEGVGTSAVTTVRSVVADPFGLAVLVTALVPVAAGVDAVTIDVLELDRLALLVVAELGGVGVEVLDLASLAA